MLLAACLRLKQWEDRSSHRTTTHQWLRWRRRPAAWLPGAGGGDADVEAVEPGVGDTISSLVLVRPGLSPPPWAHGGGDREGSLASRLLNLVEDLQQSSQLVSHFVSDF